MAGDVTKGDKLGLDVAGLIPLQSNHGARARCCLCRVPATSTIAISVFIVHPEWHPPSSIDTMALRWLSFSVFLAVALLYILYVW